MLWADRENSARQTRRGRQSPMQSYRCADCGTECLQPIYVRLHFTRNGWSRASGQKRWQKSLRLGRFCVACLLKRVRTLMGDEPIVSELGFRELNGLAEDTAAANSASNGGNRLATHTTGAAPRPASQGGGRIRHGAPGAVGAEVNPPIPPRALLARDWEGSERVCLWCGASV